MKIDAIAMLPDNTEHRIRCIMLGNDGSINRITTISNNNKPLGEFYDLIGSDLERVRIELRIEHSGVVYVKPAREPIRDIKIAGEPDDDDLDPPSWPDEMERHFDIEALCVNCGKLTSADACQCCGGMLCHQCSEVSCGFCDACLADPDFAKTMERLMGLV